jgi:hypothetical protein
MPESFDRYRRFAKRETNPLIDAPVIFFKGYTKKEVLSGIICFMVGIYAMALSILTGFALLFLAVIVPRTIKTMRQTLPRNVIAHSLWYLGFWNSGLPDKLKRPNKTYMTL